MFYIRNSSLKTKEYVLLRFIIANYLYLKDNYLNVLKMLYFMKELIITDSIIMNF
jgi:hypothetical protein